MEYFWPSERPGKSKDWENQKAENFQQTQCLSKKLENATQCVNGMCKHVLKLDYQWPLCKNERSAERGNSNEIMNEREQIVL